MDESGGETRVDRDSFAALTHDFSETARLLFSAGNVTDTLARVVELGVATIEGCDYAGLFLVEEGGVTTPVHTGGLAAEIDALQQQTGEGPCLDAIANRLIFYADDLSTDVRWPSFSPQAVSLGLRSVLALPLITDGIHGAVNHYARLPAAFGVVDRGKGVILASLASLALSAARSLEVKERRMDNLHSAMSSREIIGQAQGILMERERISADQAFDVLRRASQYLNVKLREVAQTLVDTGERPATGPSE